MMLSNIVRKANMRIIGSRGNEVDLVFGRRRTADITNVVNWRMRLAR
jgi:hypothetical protein